MSTSTSMRPMLVVLAALAGFAEGRQTNFPIGHARVAAAGGPPPQPGWAADPPGELEATVERTSKIASFLAEDVKALSEELRGLHAVLHRHGVGARQRRPGGLQAAGLRAIGAGGAAGGAWPQDVPSLVPRQPLQGIEVPPTPPQLPYGSMLGQPALQEQGPSMQGPPEQGPPAPQGLPDRGAVGLLPYEADTRFPLQADPEVMPTLSALQTSMGATDDMLEQVEAAQATRVGSVGALGQAAVATQSGAAGALGQLQAARDDPSASTTAASEAPTAAPQPGTAAPTVAAQPATAAPAAAPATSSEGDGKKCGHKGEVDCNGFMQFFTLGYRFDAFWSTVHWTCILLMVCMCCCCFRLCMPRRR